MPRTLESYTLGKLQFNCELGIEWLDDGWDELDNLLLMLVVAQSSGPLDGARCVAVGSWIGTRAWKINEVQRSSNSCCATAGSNLKMQWLDCTHALFNALLGLSWVIGGGLLGFTLTMVGPTSSCRKVVQLPYVALTQ